MSIFVSQHATEMQFSGSDSWVILSPIEKRIKEKIEAVGVPLKDWDISINYGIKTGYNEAFIIDGAKRKELIEADPKSEEIIRPILRGRDIKKYGYDFADLWLINTHNGIKEKGIAPVNIDDYPAIKTHLDKYWPELEKRADKGDTPYNLRNCAYTEDFYKPKIIYPEITKFINFYYDNKNFTANNKCFILTGKNVAYLTAFLNSSLFKYCYARTFPDLMGERRELRKVVMEEISVLQIDDNIEAHFQILVGKVQTLPVGKERKSLEKEIDALIFELYDLAENERSEIGFIQIQ